MRYNITTAFGETNTDREDFNIKREPIGCARDKPAGDPL